MDFVLTLVSSSGSLSAGHLARTERFLEQARIIFSGDVKWLDTHKAARLIIGDRPVPAQIKALRALLDDDKIDVLVTPVENRQKKLLIADMDSTIVTGETLDDIAALAGVGDQVVPVTEAAMRGEIDFKTALRQRVALLAGQPEALLTQVLEQTQLMSGAQTLTRTMRAAGATCVLVSGGFTFFTSAIAQRAGFDHHHGNVLEVKDGLLTGAVTEPILGKEAKLSYLEHYRAELGLAYEDILALGDGANDLPMLEAAGLGIGYRPKPLLRETLDNCLCHSDLRGALYAQGYKGLSAGL